MPSIVIGKSVLAGLTADNSGSCDGEGFGAFIATPSTRHIETMIGPPSGGVNFTAFTIMLRNTWREGRGGNHIRHKATNQATGTVTRRVQGSSK